MVGINAIVIFKTFASLLNVSNFSFSSLVIVPTTSTESFSLANRHCRLARTVKTIDSVHVAIVAPEERSYLSYRVNVSIKNCSNFKPSVLINSVCL